MRIFKRHDKKVETVDNGKRFFMWGCHCDYSMIWLQKYVYIFEEVGFTRNQIRAIIWFLCGFDPDHWEEFNDTTYLGTEGLV